MQDCIRISVYKGVEDYYVPDVIFNRYDLQNTAKMDTLCVTNGDNEVYVQVAYNNAEAYVGCFLMELDVITQKKIADFIFKQNLRTFCVRFENTLYSVGAFKENPQRLIRLPKTEEDLHQRLTRKNRYNLRREIRIINEQIGHIEFINYKKNNVPKSVIEKYYYFKGITHNRKFTLETTEFLEHQNITDIYVMQTQGEILAIALSCEQCNNIYFENFTYNPKYKQYSLGTVMYDRFLVSLIEKNTEVVYLGSDLYSYKRHYGSERVMAYINEIYRFGMITYLMHYIKMIYRFFYRRLAHSYND